MPTDYQSATYVARYLGVSPGSLHNWSIDPPEGFIEAESIHRGVDNQITARGWNPHDLPALRQWVAKRMKLNDEDAAAQWLLIDAELRSGTKKPILRVPPGQTAIELEDAPPAPPSKES